MPGKHRVHLLFDGLDEAAFQYEVSLEITADLHYLSGGAHCLCFQEIFLTLSSQQQITTQVYIVEIDCLIMAL